jgi:hypothetical protein
MWITLPTAHPLRSSGTEHKLLKAATAVPENAAGSSLFF